MAERIYPDLAQNFEGQQCLEERTILTVLNSDAIKINNHILERVPGPEAVYTGIDPMTDPDAVPLATEMLTTLKFLACQHTEFA